MNCEKYEQLINDLIEGELDELIADEVGLHIFACQNCTSQFEMLEREKAMYSHYLFEVEPPSNLLDKFQTKLEAHESQTILATNSSFKPIIWVSKLLNSLRLNPTFAAAIALILLTFGFGLFSLIKEQPTVEQAVDYQPSFPAIQMMLPKITKKDEVIAPVKPKKIDEIARTERSKTEPTVKPIAVKQTVTVKKEEPRPKASPQIVKPSEEQLQLKQIQTLELETAKQIEKVELLLRSFRNADLIEGSEIYDIAYERQQARKLLQNNIALRQRAESYGIFFAEEMLSKVEPYLLDIANLDIDSTPEQVLDIKERVKSQNIIASLQGF